MGARVRVKILPARELRYRLEKPEVDFDRRNGRHRGAIRTDCGFETPGANGFDGLLIQPKAGALDHLNVGGMAVWLNDHLENDNALKLGLARVFRILRLGTIKTRRVSHSTRPRTESAAACAASKSWA